MREALRVALWKPFKTVNSEKTIVKKHANVVGGN